MTSLSFYNFNIPVKNFKIASEFTQPYASRDMLKHKYDAIKRELKLTLKINRSDFLRGRYHKFLNSWDGVMDPYLEVILSGYPIEPCEALINGFVVNPIGDMYICNLVANNNRFYMGNIKTGIDRSRVRFLKEKYFKQPKECFSCWAKSFCNIGCPIVTHKKYTRRKICEETRSDFLASLKFFLKLNNSLLYKLLKENMSYKKEKMHAKNLTSDLKIIRNLYRAVNSENRYIKPVTFLPFYL